MFFKRSKKAQSTLEYMLVLGAIIAVILWAASSIVKEKVKKAYEDVNTSIKASADKIAR